MEYFYTSWKKAQSYFFFVISCNINVKNMPQSFFLIHMISFDQENYSVQPYNDHVITLNRKKTTSKIAGYCSFFTNRLEKW